MGDSALKRFFRTRLRRLLDIRRDAHQPLADGELLLLDRCIYSTLMDLREFGVDVWETVNAGDRGR